MTVETVLTALQAINVGLSGVKKAPTNLPSRLNNSDLPLVWVHPIGGTWTRQALGLHRVNVRIGVHFWVKPRAEGRAADVGYQEALDLYDLAGAAYLSNQELGLANTMIREVTDTGIRGDVDVAGTHYWGFDFVLTVKHTWTE